MSEPEELGLYDERTMRRLATMLLEEWGREEAIRRATFMALRDPEHRRKLIRLIEELDSCGGT